nr:hypothetical protein [Tanacetum cinerariifolium]
VGEELSDGGSPRVIVYGYDGLPMQPVAPLSPDYIPGLEEPRAPPVPQDEYERESMIIQPHDPNHVPEPMYPKYILLEDEHVLLAKEQPLPPVDSPTFESPGYVAESNLEEDPKEYEDNESEDGPVDYLIDRGDDGDDYEDDSSRDDTNDEDKDEEEECRLPNHFTFMVDEQEIRKVKDIKEKDKIRAKTRQNQTGNRKRGKVQSQQKVKPDKVKATKSKKSKKLKMRGLMCKFCKDKQGG